mmetsp:Transcript_21580/g.53337  ORF Transcript_21580/g.53337 Transcript_21580/m.53337 type:complete len:236 (-) Transcript_21580:1207-1914(-)
MFWNRSVSSVPAVDAAPPTGAAPAASPAPAPAPGAGCSSSIMSTRAAIRLRRMLFRCVANVAAVWPSSPSESPASASASESPASIPSFAHKSEGRCVATSLGRRVSAAVPGGGTRIGPTCMTPSLKSASTTSCFVNMWRTGSKASSSPPTSLMVGRNRSGEFGSLMYASPSVHTARPPAVCGSLSPPCLDTVNPSTENLTATPTSTHGVTFPRASDDHITVPIPSGPGRRSPKSI